MNRGRGGKFGSRGGGGGGGRGGGGGGGPVGMNQSRPQYKEHLRDLELELELLQRKRQIIEQEQNMLDRFTNNTDNYLPKYSQQGSSNYSNNSNTRQYDSKQPFYNQQGPRDYSSVDYSYASSRPGNSNTRSQGVKRHQIWENPSPPKRFNTSQNINPWQNQDPTPQYRAGNSGTSQPNKFTAQTRSSGNLKPSVGQRITNKYNPQPERKNFKPSKVTKPNQKSNNPSTYYTSEQTKILIEEANKLIAHTNTLMVRNPKPKFQNPNPTNQVIRKKPNPVTLKKKVADEYILRPNIEPFGPLKGRLELGLGTILKSVKELCNTGTYQIFMLPFIQRMIKYTIRKRIKEVMMNKTVTSVTEIVENYRQKYPKETDYELLKIAHDADKYCKMNRSVLQLIESDNPDQFFSINFNRVLSNRLDHLFEDVKKVYAKREYTLEDTIRMFTNESENQDSKIVEKPDNEEKKDADEEKDIHERNVTDGHKDNEDQKDSNEKTKDTDVQKDLNEENKEEEKVSNEQNNEPKSETNTEDSNIDYVKNMVEEIELRNPKTKYYFDFVDKLIEKRLPYVLPKYKDTIMSLFSLNKEFLNSKALILTEMNEKFKEQRSRRIENIITLDDDDDVEVSASNSATEASAVPAPNSNSEVTTAATNTAVSTSLTPVNLITTPAKKPSTPGTSSTSVKSSTTTTQTARPAVSATPATEITAAKQATTLNAASSMTPLKDDQKNIPSTPKAANSKDILYVKLIGRPALPARAVIYEFLNRFKPTSIKKHKTVNNLLVIGFFDKEGYENILSATGSVLGESTLIIKASEQVTYTPTQNKTSQQVNKTPISNKIPIKKESPVQNKTSEQQTSNTDQNKTSEKETTNIKATDDQNIEINKESEEPDKLHTKANASADNVLNTSDDISEFDTQIDDLLSSIRETEEENDDLNQVKSSEVSNSADVAKMDTETELDNEVMKVTNKADEKTEDIIDENKEKQDNIDQNNDNDKVTSDTDKSNTNSLDTIMEVDDETKKEKAVKGVKESGRATPTRTSSRLANVTPSTIKTRRASRLANN